MSTILGWGLVLVCLGGGTDITPIDACPGTESCCLEHGPRACNDAECCEAVCAKDADCCGVGWSNDCVTLAQTLCGDLCPAPVCPGSGDCCEEHGVAGCEDHVCCELVCDERPSCCTDFWDAACAALAESLCDPLCAVSAGCPGTGNCCLRNGSPGCDDPDCCATVCTADSFCCIGEWDDICARKANQLCGGGGGSFCEWCPSEGDCCEGRGTPGCERVACCDLVCSMTSRCCTEFWDSGCANLATNVCAETACLCDFFGELDEVPFVDLGDAAVFQNCFTGSGGGPIDEPCACADSDGDGDVDLIDYFDFAPYFGSE